MANNRITKIFDHSFKGCSSLSFLDLSQNIINNITDLAFQYLKGLKIIYLNTNQIKLSSLTPGVFSHLCDLERLQIDDNIIENDSLVQGGIFEKLSSLNYLQLDGFPNATFSAEFAQLQNLSTLVVKGQQMYIHDKTFSCFQNSSSVEELIISSQLIDVTRHSFSHFSCLKTLDLSNNTELGFPNISKSLYGLVHTRIESLYLVKSAPYEYAFIVIDESFTEGLHNTRIKKIVLDGNNILVIDAKFRIHTPHLEYLSVEYNRLVQTQLLTCDVYFLKNLTYVSAASQSKRLPDDAGISRKLSNYHVNSLSSGLNDTCDDALFHFGDVIRLAIPPYIEYGNLSATLTEDFKHLKKTLVYGKNYALKYFNYASNGLQILEGPFIIIHVPPAPITLDLSDNGCYYMGPEFVKYNTGGSIGIMYFNYNRLGEQFLTDKNCSVFKYMPNLIELHIAFNMIKSLPPFIFINQLELQILNLSHNSLQFLDFHLDHMVKLTYLDLSSNLITQLDTHYTHLWLSVSSNRSFSIALKDNPLVCSCESLVFLQWLMITKINVTHWKNYTCTYNRHLKELFYIENISSDLAIECSSKQWILISSLTFCSVVLMVLIAMVFYRHKFEIKIFCLKLTYQWKQYQILRDTQYYEYDAFVAFHESDLDFVTTEIVLNLEENDEFKLCIHHRNFIVGGSIEENILAAIEKSRKTIVILSENFLKSGWCDFEYKMARVRGFEEGVDIIIPIVKGELSNVENMSRSIRALLRKNTYIQWPEHLNQVDEFWQKIKAALRRPVICD